MTKKNSNIILVVLLATIMGLGAGIAGELLTRQYLLADLYNFPFLGEVDISETGLNTPNFVIKGAPKITVEQNKRISEVAENSAKNIVGIFRKINKDSPDNFYDLRQPVSQGFAITTDGWIIAEFKQASLAEEKVKENYLAISASQKTYNFDKIQKIPNSNFIFFHLNEARELPVLKINSESEIQAGDLALVLDWSGKRYISYISEKTNSGEGLVESSDLFKRNLVLTGNPEKIFSSGFVFSLDNGISGIVDAQGQVQSINNFRNRINNLLKHGDKKNPALGVNYINLSEVLFAGQTRQEGALIYPDNRGVAVEKDSPADRAGLKEGDVITSLDGQSLNSNTSLNYEIWKREPGEEINLSYLREGERKTLKIILD